MKNICLTIATVVMLCSVASAQMGASLVPPSSATDTAKQSGSWQDSATWTDGTVPVAGEKVFIPAGFTVTNHATTADVLWIHAAGTLACCDHCDTQINVHTIYVPMGGKLKLHSTGKAVVEFIDGPFLPGDTTQLSRGLICHGEFMASGNDKLDWCAVADSQLAVGSNTLTCAVPPTGWNVGDKLVICGTDSKVGEAWQTYQSEFVTVASISGGLGGLSVGFDPPLKYRHFRWRADLPFHVGNLTRNVVFRSRDTSTIANRGHLMFMSSMVNMRNVAVEGCGRSDGSRPITDPRLDAYGELIPGSDANVRARYAVHWHRVGQLTPPAICTGCVVDGSPKWGFLVHASNVHLQDCVATRCYGGGFATEEGQERGSMDRCLSVLNRGYGDVERGSDDDHGRSLIGDFGIAGDGFWNHSGLMAITNCVACDNSGRGFGQFIRTLNGYPNYGSGNPIPEYLRFPIEHDGTLLSIDYDGRSKTPASTVPPAVFANNTAYGAKLGFQGWSGPVNDASSNRIWPASVRGSIRNLTLWGRGGKLHLEYNRQLNVEGLTIVGDNGFRPAFNSIFRLSEAVLLRSPEVTVSNWSIEHVSDHMAKLRVVGVNDPGGIAGKNINIQGATVNADGSVTIP